MKYDIFISYAHEDKDDFVSFLAKNLINAGFKVWYDEFSLKIGDSLSEKINYGLANSLKGIVILSKSFFKKDWTKRELRGLTARESDGKQIILPIWHNITKDEVVKFSPPLADIIAIDSNESINYIVNNIKEAFIQDVDFIQEKIDFKKQDAIYKQKIEANKTLEYNVIIDKEKGRYFLEKLLPKKLRRHKNKKVSIVLLDIDDLTIINKMFNKDIGNEIINEIILILGENLKIIKKISHYYYGRTGDDTFYVVLSNCTIGKAKKISELLRGNIENNDWFNIVNNLRVTCSFGVGQFNFKEPIIDTIVRTALAMKKSKVNGKNSVQEAPKYLGVYESRNLREHYS